MQLKETHKSIFPSSLPVFPLSGALLLPGGRLPLNIFEERYLNLVTDTLGKDRISFEDVFKKVKTYLD